ncbi:MAG: class I SAM-dependent methyltransferase [bacterium]
MISQAPRYAQPQSQDPYWLNIKELPYFRALLRAVEAREYQDIPLEQPILDLGCGDGHFVTTAFETQIDTGLDPWTGPLRQAARRKSYCVAVHGQGAQLPFPDGYFASAMSNSVLEHIENLDPVMEEVVRVLKPGAKFVFCVPNHRFLANLSVSSALDRIGLKRLAEVYRRFFNRISRHHHCDDLKTWQERLRKAGLMIEEQWDYFSPAATHVLEWGHYFGLPSLVMHFLFRRWIVVPAKWSLSLTRLITKKYYNEARRQPQGSYSFYITRKV